MGNMQINTNLLNKYTLRSKDKPLADFSLYKDAVVINGKPVASYRLVIESIVMLKIMLYCRKTCPLPLLTISCLRGLISVKRRKIVNLWKSS